jgi:hypothetical protein
MYTVETYADAWSTAYEIALKVAKDTPAGVAFIRPDHPGKDMPSLYSVTKDGKVTILSRKVE